MFVSNFRPHGPMDKKSDKRYCMAFCVVKENISARTCPNQRTNKVFIAAEIKTKIVFSDFVKKQCGFKKWNYSWENDLYQYKNENFGLIALKYLHINHMWFFTPLPLGPKGCRPLHVPFRYYTNMVQEIEFIIHANIQPFFYPPPVGGF